MDVTQHRRTKLALVLDARCGGGFSQRTMTTDPNVFGYFARPELPLLAVGNGRLLLARVFNVKYLAMRCHARRSESLLLLQ